MSKRIYLVTAIPYVNAKPHLGHALEFILGDALIRYYRKNNYEVLSQIGTDEYGQKLERTAKKLNRDPKEYCDEMSQHFQELKSIFNLSFDMFIRTTDEKHRLSAQKIWRKAKEAGDIYKKKYSGLYCTGCESFKTERDLVNGKCPDHDIEPEEIHEENYFFKLSKYQNAIKKWLLDNPKIVFPESRYKEILNVVTSGLDDISVSRPRSSLNWGIEVPDDKDHVMYVWFDALTNYITGVGFEDDEDKFQKWWQGDTKTIHILGKDIIRHHIAIWPAMLLSAGLSLPKQYIVHGFITSKGQKMSKSIGNVIDPVEYAKKYGSDALRWYLLKEIPNGQDGDFITERFIEIYNADLANNIGNLFNRVVTLLLKYGIKIPKNLDNISFIDKTKTEYNTAFDEYKTDKACWALISLCNQANSIIEETKPWILAKSDLDKLNEVMIELFTYLVNIYEMSIPFIPNAAEKMKISLGVDDGYNVQKIEALFPRI